MIDYFDNIYCINLDRRPDRWLECQSEFKKLNIENQVTRFSAFDMNPGIAGCTRSHYEVIKLAKSKNEKNILILEDDFSTVCDNVWSYFDKALEQMSNKNICYDMFYFGGRIIGKEGAVKVDSNLLKLNYVKCAHMYSVTDRVYDAIINIYKDINWNNNAHWDGSSTTRLNDDYIFATKIQPKYNVYGIYPGMAQQRTSHSDLLNRPSGEVLWNINEDWNKKVI